MNFKTIVARVGLAAGLVVTSAAPSLATGNLTPADLGLDAFDPSKPVTGETQANAAPLVAFPYQARTFSFTKERRIRFSLIQPTGLGSRGKSQSSFGFVMSPEKSGGTFKTIFAEVRPFDSGSNAQTNDWLGTCGTSRKNAILAPCEREIAFRGGTLYQLALNTGNAMQFGVGALDQYTFNTVSDQFYPQAGSFTTVAEPGALFIGMEDGQFRRSGNRFYYDYQDWVVKAEAVPEPATLLGLGVLVGGMLLTQRRKAQSA
ncbi:MAG: PEP-CTERM sorting domain-containing protein [Synechococcales cyanobacterium M58_A2018_015]|nr:PEP-CTERM sorting domain-containing protein [Synechococcales cyanobacterium M58_A2018_015]